jgi:transcriptional regulator with XRE-family HTH domain
MMDHNTSASAAELLRGVEGAEEIVDALQKRIAQRQIIKHLMALRASKGLSQKDIATVFGCTQSKISKLESGIDDDLKLGDLESYLAALGLEPSLVLKKKGHTIVDEIKYHWSCLGHALNKLLGLAHRDPDIAVNVGKFSNEVAFNYLARIFDFINGLPEIAKTEAPSFRIVMHDVSGDCPEIEESPDSPALGYPGCRAISLPNRGLSPYLA